MGKSSSEAIGFEPLHNVDDDEVFELSPAGPDSDTSSLASLLNENDDIEDVVMASTAASPIQPFKTVQTASLDPKNWSPRKKMFVAVTIAIYTSVFYSGSSIFMVSVPGVMIQYGVGQEKALLGLSLYVLSYGLGPLLWAPLSEVRWIGRNPVYIFTMVIFVIVSFSTATTALRSLTGFMALRFVQGFFGSPCLANGGASMHDIYNDRELPYALGVWIAFAYAGPALGPAVAAYATERNGWQFPMWFVAFCSVPACILLFFLPETSLPKIMYRQGRKDTGYARVSETQGGIYDHSNNTGGPSAAAHDNIWETLKDSLIKPVQISILDPSVSFVNLYTSFCYATYYTFFDSLPITYMTKYGFTLSEVAVACTCIMLGCLAGAISYFAYIYFVVNRRSATTSMTTAKTTTNSKQEDRLIPALVAVCLIPIGICIFAFASNGKIHWSVGMCGIAIYSAAVFVILQCLCMYMLKSYPPYAASLFAANDACRSILAAGAVHLGVPYYRTLGIVWGCGLLAAISCLGIGGMWILYLRGEKLRARSRFASR